MEISSIWRLNKSIQFVINQNNMTSIVIVIKTMSFWSVASSITKL